MTNTTNTRFRICAVWRVQTYEYLAAADRADMVLKSRGLTMPEGWADMLDEANADPHDPTIHVPKFVDDPSGQQLMAEMAGFYVTRILHENWMRKNVFDANGDVRQRVMYGDQEYSMTASGVANLLDPVRDYLAAEAGGIVKCESNFLATETRNYLHQPTKTPQGLAWLWVFHLLGALPPDAPLDDMITRWNRIDAVEKMLCGAFRDSDGSLMFQEVPNTRYRNFSMVDKDGNRHDITDAEAAAQVEAAGGSRGPTDLPMPIRGFEPSPFRVTPRRNHRAHQTAMRHQKARAKARRARKASRR